MSESMRARRPDFAIGWAISSSLSIVTLRPSTSTLHDVAGPRTVTVNGAAVDGAAQAMVEQESSATMIELRNHRII